MFLVAFAMMRIYKMSLETSTCVGKCALGLNIEADILEPDTVFDPIKLDTKMLN